MWRDRDGTRIEVRDRNGNENIADQWDRSKTGKCFSGPERDQD